MKKKILLMISMCLIVLGLTACGEADPTKVDYNGITYDQLKGACENAVSTLQNLSESEKAAYLASGDETLEHLVSRWEEAQEGVGEFVELGKFTITKSGKTLTCEQEIIYKNRPVILTYVYTYHNMQLEDITVDQVQTLGEKMSNAALNTLMGMGVVFAVLILISLIISCFKFLSYFEKKGKEETAPAVKEPVAPVPPSVQEAIAAQDDLELAAVIAAAIAASTGTSTDGFVVRSIKRRF